MLNKYMWETYLSSVGKGVVKSFEENLKNKYTSEYSEFVGELHKEYCPSSNINMRLQENLEIEVIADLYESVDYNFLEEGEYTIESAIEYIYNKLFQEDDTEKSLFEYFSCYIEIFTTLFTIELPELLVPYYFKYNFNLFENIAEEFGIKLPDIPVKKDYKGRFLYYGKICEVLYEFRQENNMTPYELCAFLYDFAPKYVGGISSYIITDDLPEARSAYFIGGHKNDAFLSDDIDIITPWQCSPDTKAGDNIVMYLKSPISAIDSIWRSVSVGFNDPFFYYYRCTYIAHPTKIKKITKKKLEKDCIFKKMPIVRKNMQGINGVELYPSEYNHLIDISKAQMPKFEVGIDDDTSEIKREKDVEEKLIKPFLKKMGYSEDDYIQQLRIKVGNHNSKLIPDFTVRPRISNGHYFAFYHIEAKYSIPDQKEFQEVKIQSRSYAKILGAEYSVIGSKEGIWISEKSDDYENDIVVCSWKELNNSDVFYKVSKILGK